jgi:hypothetical protein
MLDRRKELDACSRVKAAMARLALSLLVSVLLLAPAAADAQLMIGVQDDPVFVRGPASYGGFGTRGLMSSSLGYTRMSQLGAGILRIAINWSAVQPRRSREDWSHYDAAIARAEHHHFTVQLVLTGPAPAFATGNRRVGTYRPNAAAYARFAERAVRRYRHTVTTYSIWNEPNWWSWLQPHQFAPSLYRGLYSAAYSAIKRADPEAKVLIGELAPLAETRRAIAPLRFLRDVVCRGAGLRRRASCGPLYADGFALHPYTLGMPPSFPGNNVDDATTGSLSRVVRLLGALARLHALATPKGKPLPVYLTEYGWSPHYFASESRRAEMARAGFATAARHPQVREVVWYELAAPPGNHVYWDTALLTHGGGRTPVFNVLSGWIIHVIGHPRPERKKSTSGTGSEGAGAPATGTPQVTEPVGTSPPAEGGATPGGATATAASRP